MLKGERRSRVAIGDGGEIFVGGDSVRWQEDSAAGETCFLAVVRILELACRRRRAGWRIAPSRGWLRLEMGWPVLPEFIGAVGRTAN